MFRITKGTGFHITFENGYTVSVQFGGGTYSDHYDGPIGGAEAKVNAEHGSTTAECAVWPRGGNLLRLPDGGEVSNRSTPAEVLALLNWAASLPEVTEEEIK